MFTPNSRNSSNLSYMKSLKIMKNVKMVKHEIIFTINSHRFWLWPIMVPIGCKRSHMVNFERPKGWEKNQKNYIVHSSRKIIKNSFVWNILFLNFNGHFLLLSSILMLSFKTRKTITRKMINPLGVERSNFSLE